MLIDYSRVWVVFLIIVFGSLAIWISSCANVGNADIHKKAFKVELKDCKKGWGGTYKCKVNLYETTYARYLLGGFVEGDKIEIPVKEKTIVGIQP